ncbi:hypothetical protein BpHYR1_043771 [Brachionus plicatilis]|uniref:Uncharacterized protein n=1 Tax=Brachionus plicatilis TaxID=10195 RepID=A0A3M7RKF6_BRAPC|nr:hypothetical protein BpHYR1_043771 [Brachionus plicatilis]
MLTLKKSYHKYCQNFLESSEQEMKTRRMRVVYPSKKSFIIKFYILAVNNFRVIIFFNSFLIIEENVEYGTVVKKKEMFKNKSKLETSNAFDCHFLVTFMPIDSDNLFIVTVGTTFECMSTLFMFTLFLYNRFFLSNFMANLSFHDVLNPFSDKFGTILFSENRMKKGNKLYINMWTISQIK